MSMVLFIETSSRAAWLSLHILQDEQPPCYDRNARKLNICGRYEHQCIQATGRASDSCPSDGKTCSQAAQMLPPASEVLPKQALPSGGGCSLPKIFKWAVQVPSYRKQ